MRRARRSVELAARVGRTALGAAVLLLAQSAFAQLKDVPPPPRLDPAPTVFTISPKDLSDKPKDPSTLTAVFDLPPGTEPTISTRVKMAQTSNVYALVKADGKYYVAAKEIKVTLGGCGG